MTPGPTRSSSSGHRCRPFSKSEQHTQTHTSRPGIHGPAFDRGTNKSENDQDARKKYWRTNLTYLAILLSIWFIVSYGCGIILVDYLNQFRIGQAKLGFWFAQQGSIYTFVILIAVYVVLMNKLDRKFGFREDD